MDIVSGINVQPDIVLRLDARGVICEATLSSAISGQDMAAWVGRPWRDTVADVGADKVQRILEDARTAGVSAFRQVNQRFPSGLELPVEYTAVRLGGKAGLIAIGKSLQAVAELQSRLVAAQQAMERDYWKFREIETRYRMLFRVSSEPVVLLSASTMRVTEANPAALRALGLAQQPDRVAGLPLLDGLSASERGAMRAMLDRVRESGKAAGVMIHLGADRKAWTVRASMMRSEPEAVFLLQFVQTGDSQAAAEFSQSLQVHDLIDRLPDAFVVIDRGGRIRRANRAFLSLAQMGAEGAVLGQPLARWLSRPGADMAVLMSNLLRNHAVRLFTTTLRGELGGETEIEISAIGDADEDPSAVGLLMRDVGRRLPARAEPGGLRAALANIDEQVGKVSLKRLVQETVGVVERHYVDAALELADGNRTMAAELLGLSRQSLYAKLARYGIDGGDSGGSDG